MPIRPGCLSKSFIRRCTRPDFRHSTLNLTSNLSLPKPRFSHAIRPGHMQTFMTAPRAPNPDEPFEEEALPDYEPEQFYPIHIGETLNRRYDVIGKLGFGANSTVWFGQDTRTNDFVTLKVYVRTPPAMAHRERIAHEHLSTLKSSHPGQDHIRQPLDTFSLHQSDGSQHLCFVYSPLQTTLFDLQRLGGKAQPLPEELVKEVLRYLLEALDYLHTDAGMIHCDIKLSNMMLQIEDLSVLSAFVEDEQINPTPRKIINAKRTIYASRKFRYPKGHAFGPPVLCDFGEARIGSTFPYTNIQPDLYKAPELLLLLDWNQSVDIWNVGCVAWDMVQARHLFDARDEEGHHNNRVHLGEMVGLLGHPPLDFQRRSEHSWRVFDDEGKWKDNPPLSPVTLEDKVQHLPQEFRQNFVRFLRSMLRWRPEDRPSARGLLDDPWLKQ